MSVGKPAPRGGLTDYVWQTRDNLEQGGNSSKRLRVVFRFSLPTLLDFAQWTYTPTLCFGEKNTKIILGRVHEGFFQKWTDPIPTPVYTLMRECRIFEKIMIPSKTADTTPTP